MLPLHGRARCRRYGNEELGVSPPASTPKTEVATAPTVVCGVNLLAAAVAYSILQSVIARRPGGDRLREAIGRDTKGWLSPVLYAVGIGLSFVVPWLGLVPYVAVAVIWLIPDRRIERYLAAHPDDEN